MATDKFGGSRSLFAPLSGAANVVPNDAVDLTNTTRAIYVGVSGDVKVTMADGGDVTLVGLNPGAWHWIRVTRIWATGTGAQNILAGW